MKKLLGLTLAATMFVPALAFAQTATSEPRYDELYNPEAGHNRASVGIMADVGTNKYNRGLAGDSNVGISYGAHLDFSPARVLGIELGYAGAVNDLNSNISTDGRLITNQIGGDLRFNMVPPSYDLPLGLRPFIFGGAAYQRVDTHNFTPGFSSGNLFAIPVGGGIEADLGKTMLVGARFTYNFLFNETDSFGGRSADNWLTTVNLGARL